MSLPSVEVLVSVPAVDGLLLELLLLVFVFVVVFELVFFEELLLLVVLELDESALLALDEVVLVLFEESELVLDAAEFAAAELEDSALMLLSLLEQPTVARTAGTATSAFKVPIANERREMLRFGITNSLTHTNKRWTVRGYRQHSKDIPSTAARPLHVQLNQVA